MEDETSKKIVRELELIRKKIDSLPSYTSIENLANKIPSGNDSTLTLIYVLMVIGYFIFLTINSGTDSVVKNFLVAFFFPADLIYRILAFISQGDTMFSITLKLRYNWIEAVVVSTLFILASIVNIFCTVFAITFVSYITGLPNVLGNVIALGFCLPIIYFTSLTIRYWVQLVRILRKELK